MTDSTGGAPKRIALVAHDSKKRDMADWVRANAERLRQHSLIATGTTGRVVSRVLGDGTVTPLKSGPLGGDQQLGAMIAEGGLDLLIFFVDPMTPLPHDVDVKALTRLAILYNLPMACNRATADLLITSPDLWDSYERAEPDYSDYISRIVEQSVPDLGTGGDGGA